ncbi:MAG: transcription termination/antitermination protein NusA [Clostridia bacterium]|nr:transcription termination/antitermination protein NusA [Clostridia bacterium]MBR7062117.1 transcription termination/antitermination protein NusA [Clostridia bacterium]
MSELYDAVVALAKEKGIKKEIIIQAIEEALNTAYGRESTGMDTRVEFNEGDIRVYAQKVVVEHVTDPKTEFSLEEARKIDPEFIVGDIAEEDVTHTEFEKVNVGRLIAQKGKQLIVQKLREEERKNVYSEFKEKEGDLVTGTIQRIETKENRDGTKERIIHVDLGRIEGIMLPSEQVIGEQYRLNERIKAYVVETREKSFKSKDPCVMISRTHPGLVRRLCEMEIPEIGNGIVEIMNVAREAGSRTKIAVRSNDENIEPVGACVGQKGTRIQTIVDELKGERIDIVKWSPDPEEFIAASLSPARVLSVFMDYVPTEKGDKTIPVGTVIVEDRQLSLAIGREGQNVRLAAKLTDCKIDIKSESQLRDSVAEELFHEGLSENMAIGGDNAAAADVSPLDKDGNFDPDLV